MFDSNSEIICLIVDKLIPYFFDMVNMSCPFLLVNTKNKKLLVVCQVRPFASLHQRLFGRINNLGAVRLFWIQLQWGPNYSRFNNKLSFTKELLYSPCRRCLMLFWIWMHDSLSHFFFIWMQLSLLITHKFL